jgi:hypothetical protein
MRLLLSFILLFSFFITPLRSSAGTMSATKATKLTGSKLPKTTIIDYLVNDHTAVINNTSQYKIYNTRYRSFSYADLFNTDCSIKATIPVPETKYFVVPHLYCTSIGLKLIFPKHYFW